MDSASRDGPVREARSFCRHLWVRHFMIGVFPVIKTPNLRDTWALHRCECRADPPAMRKLRNYSVIPALRGTPLLRYTSPRIPFWHDAVTPLFYANIYGCWVLERRGVCLDNNGNLQGETRGATRPHGQRRVTRRYSCDRKRGGRVYPSGTVSWERSRRKVEEREATDRHKISR